MLEEDLEEERFYVTVRRALLGGAAGRTGAPDCRRADPDARLLMDYKQAGVDIEAGNEVVRRIRSLARGTFTPGVLSDIGSFGGLFRLETSALADPVLVASADGVGTKLRVAFLAGIHRTIGVDLVNHCVNDILVQGAQPLFFLDYLATGRLEPDVAVQVVEGLSAACRENGCALLGGETAEMPGFYADGEYDVAGFIVGASRAKPADRREAHRRRAMRSSAFRHRACTPTATRSRGGSCSTSPELRIDSAVAELGTTIGAALLEPHRSYLPLIRPLLPSGVIKGMAHITGGGITDNLPRILPEGTARSCRSLVLARARDLPVAPAHRERSGRRHDAHVQHGNRADRRVRQRISGSARGPTRTRCRADWADRAR